MTPIYGHIDEQSAYVIDDYPYGFRLRCKIRYWLEHKDGFGWRLVSQTTNPKKGNIWNKPKASTYSNLAACMYLDDNGHVHWSGLSAYSSIEDMQKFIDTFTGVDTRVIKLLNKIIEKRTELKLGY